MAGYENVLLFLFEPAERALASVRGIRGCTEQKGAQGHRSNSNPFAHRIYLAQEDSKEQPTTFTFSAGFRNRGGPRGERQTAQQASYAIGVYFEELRAGPRQEGHLPPAPGTKGLQK